MQINFAATWLQDQNKKPCASLAAQSLKLYKGVCGGSKYASRMYVHLFNWPVSPH
jgi:hypothetical protein